MSNTPWDFAAYDRKGQLILSVDVRKLLDKSHEWVLQLRHNLLEHDNISNSPYFLLAMPDHFYLWQNNDVMKAESEPSYTIDARPLLARYFENTDLSPVNIDGDTFDLIISAWLGNLIYGGKPKQVSESERWLLESGLYDALSGGRLMFPHEILA